MRRFVLAWVAWAVAGTTGLAQGAYGTAAHAEAAAQGSDEPRATGVLEVIAIAEETGAPVAGARVSLSSSVEGWNPGRVFVADSDGRVVCDVPANQRIYLWAQCGEHEPSTRGLGTLGPGERRRIEVSVETTETLLAVVQVLAAENDAPIDGARVALEHSPGSESSVVFTTGADGLATLRFEKPLRYAAVDAEGRATQRLQISNGWSVGEGTTVVRLQRDASLAVRVLDAEGAGLEGLDVFLSEQRAWSLDSGFLYLRGPPRFWMESRTAADGTCTFEGLPPELPLELEVRRATTVAGNVQSEPVWIEPKAVTLVPGESRSIEVSTGTGTGTTIKGQLLDQHGRAAIAHGIALIGAEGEPHRILREGEYVIAGTRTDGMGNFALHDVPSGSWWLGPVASDSPYSLAGLPELLVLEPGAAEREVVLRGHRGLYVEGRLVDSNGEPESGFVFIETAASTPTDEGAFRIGPLLPGTHALRVVPSWGAPPFAEPIEQFALATAAEAGAKDVVIVLQRGGTLGVAVRDAAGRRVRADIEVWRGGEFCTRRECVVGSTNVSGLLVGSYSVTATSSEGWAVARDVAIEAETERFPRVSLEVSLVLAPAGRLKVRYAGQSAYGHLEVWSSDGIVAAASVATGTSYTCSLPPGPLRLVMKSSTHGTQQRTVDARESELVEVSFE